ncbi:MAG: hypothetical protein MUP68_05035, partial [Deltaproteobacteria bacterium]|nr:hypothetical protein [Deltaproteobacteria bacterium]
FLFLPLPQFFLQVYPHGIEPDSCQAEKGLSLFITSEFDDLVKNQKSRHSCESRSPELVELTGFPLSRE